MASLILMMIPPKEKSLFATLSAIENNRSIEHNSSQIVLIYEVSSKSLIKPEHFNTMTMELTI